MIVRNTSTDKRSLNAGGGEGVYTRDADKGMSTQSKTTANRFP